MEINHKCLWCKGGKFKNNCKRADGINVVECLECGLKQIEYIPDALLQVYDSDTYFENQSDNKIGYDNYHEFLLQPFLWKYAFFKLFCTKSRGELLDIGCATGKFLELIEGNSFSTYGIDISSSAVNLGKTKGLNVTCSSFDELDMENETYDVITAWDLIEHVETPKELFSKCERLLKPNGVLLFSTPDAGSDIAIEMGSQWGGYTTSLEHLTFFTSDFLSKHVREIFGTDLNIYSFTHDEKYSTLVGFIRKGGISGEDMLVDECLKYSKYPLQTKNNENITIYLSIIYIHYEVNLDKVKETIESLKIANSNQEYLLLKPLVYYRQGKFEEAAEMLYNLSKASKRDSIVWQCLIETLQNIAYKLEAHVETKTNEVLDLESQMELKNNTILNLESQMELKNNTILDLESQMGLKNNTILDFESQMELKNNTILDLESQMELKNNTILDLESQMELKNNEISDLEINEYNLKKSLENYKVYVESLKKELDRIHDLKSWQIIVYVNSLYSKIVHR